MPCLTPYRGDTPQMLLFKIASCLEASGSPVSGVTSFNGVTGAVTGVTSFNGRDGVVILTLADVAAVADGRYVLKTGDTMTGPLSAGVVSIPIALSLGTAAPLSMVSGANQRAGDVTLVGGTVTTANTTVTANTRVFVSRKTIGGTPGTEFVYTLVAGVSFTITSNLGTDTSVISYLLIEVP